MARRFYEQVSVEETAEGHIIRLDEHKLMTPAKNLLALPYARLAEAVAAEWRQVDGDIISSDMPMSRLVYTALDRVSETYDATAQAFASYGETDLLCYRATHPDALLQRQDEIWTPYLDWVKSSYGVSLQIGAGIAPIKQLQSSIEILTRVAKGGEGVEPNPLRLTGLAHGAGLLGSAVLALHMEAGEAETENIWRAAFLDEFFQFEQWGDDSEAMARLDGLKREIQTLSDYFSLFFS
ncbi:MAG: ATPase [PS1 clade bacterium]|jgi:chaperone required for assembly of F1-ATPase|uniref:ATPase n=1 Tax=PS1 clade bacterium TaxID=2175152 RepID=A0A368DZN4_9PROT|nr:MAG: ATPase [PS1 clade bacterium]|tara:strand:+ start:17790 stop:18503 length:714 start_codon:yes stop_codon:yes gene_type:complete